MLKISVCQRVLHNIYELQFSEDIPPFVTMFFVSRIPSLGAQEIRRDFCLKLLSLIVFDHQDKPSSFKREL